MSTIRRRAFLGGIAGASALGAGGIAIARALTAPDPPIGAPRSDLEPTTLRVGVMANLTHAPLLAGLGSKRIEQALGPMVKVETVVFRAGPRVTEALIGGAIDVGTAGPAPVVIHHARHTHGKSDNRAGLRILAGCCSGGASLVVGRSTQITRASDLRGKRIAVTQIGTTQDIALRTYLRDNGLRDVASGGDVDVLAIAGATILDQMKRGELHGAWLPEPWATRIVQELGASRFIDERDLWPDRRFATAVLASRASRAADPNITKLITALEAEVARAIEDPKSTLLEAHTELKRRVGNPGSFSIFTQAAGFMDFTSDPVRESIERLGDAASSLGLCPLRPTTGLFA